MLSASVVALLLIGMLSQGHALSCITCMDQTSDNPSLPLPPGNCGDNPPSEMCPDGITQCMTLSLDMMYSLEGVGDIMLTQTQRSCAAMPFAEPNNRCLSDEEFQPIATMTQAAMEAALSGGSQAPPLTFQSLSGSVCICETDDCTPPGPSAADEGGDEEPANQAEPTSEPEVMTTKGGATNVVSSAALLLASMLSALVCKAL